MNNIMEYKNYVGSVEFSENDGLFYGKVQGIRSLISYEGYNAAELVDDFHEAVDEYLSDCYERNSMPETPYKGRLNVRLKNRNLHRQATIYAFQDMVETKGRMKTAINTLNRYTRRQLPINRQVLEDIAEDNEITVEKVRDIARQNGIALSC